MGINACVALEAFVLISMHSSSKTTLHGLFKIEYMYETVFQSIDEFATTGTTKCYHGILNYIFNFLVNEHKSKYLNQ